VPSFTSLTSSAYVASRAPFSVVGIGCGEVPGRVEGSVRGEF
jgi:hypothetical protein